MNDKACFDVRGIGFNDVALFMADGSRVLVDKTQYFKQLDRENRNKAEELNVREPNKVKRPINKRSGPVKRTEYKQNNFRRAAPGKRIPVLPLIH